jgi:hypothetical protein
MFAIFLQTSFVFLLKEKLLDAYWILHCVVYSMQPVRVLLGCSAFVVRHWSHSMSDLIQILSTSGQRHVKYYKEKMT